MLNVYKNAIKEGNTGFITHRRYKLWGGIFATVGILVGIAYILAQLIENGNVVDKTYSGILIANIYAIYQFELFFISYFSREYDEAYKSVSKLEGKISEKDYMVNVFRGYGNVISGFVYGLIASFLFYGPWVENSLIFYIYIVFVFLSNSIAGSAIHSLIKYFYRINKLGKHTNISLWDRSCGVYNFIMESDKYVLYAVGYIAVTAIIASLFSILGTDAPGYIWSIWSVIVLILTFSLPLIPVSNKIKKLKDDNLELVNKNLQTYYDKLQNKIENHDNEISFDEINSIKKLKGDIKSIRVFPPVGAKSLETAAIISILTLLPSLLEFLFIAT